MCLNREGFSNRELRLKVACEDEGYKSFCCSWKESKAEKLSEEGREIKLGGTPVF